MNKNTKNLIRISQMVGILFLVFRGGYWIVNHSVSHHLLDELAGVAFLMLAVSLVASDSASGEDRKMNRLSSALVITVGIGSLIVSLAGIAAILYFLG